MPWRGTALQARFLMAKNAFRWLDDTLNFTKRAAFRNIVDDLIVDSDGRLDPQDMIAKMAEVIPASSGSIRLKLYCKAQGIFLRREPHEGPEAGFAVLGSRKEHPFWRPSGHECAFEVLANTFALL